MPQELISSKLKVRPVPQKSISGTEQWMHRIPRHVVAEGIDELPWVTAYLLSQEEKKKGGLIRVVKRVIGFIEENIIVRANLVKGGIRITIILTNVVLWDRVIGTQA